MFKEGKRIPHCAFEFQLLEGRSLQRLFHRVNLLGLSLEKFFHIRYPQPESELHAIALNCMMFLKCIQFNDYIILNYLVAVLSVA